MEKIKRYIFHLLLIICLFVMFGCEKATADIDSFSIPVDTEVSCVPTNPFNKIPGCVLFADGSMLYCNVENNSMQHAIYYEESNGVLHKLYEGEYYNLNLVDSYIYAQNAEDTSYLPQYLDRINLSTGEVERFGKEIISAYACADNRILYQANDGTYRISDWECTNEATVISDISLDLSEGNSFLMMPCDDFVIFYSTRSEGSVYLYDYKSEPTLVCTPKSDIVSCFIRDNRVFVLTLTQDPKQYHVLSFSADAPSELEFENITIALDDPKTVHVVTKDEQELLLSNFHCEVCITLCTFGDYTVVHSKMTSGCMYLYDNGTILAK